MMAEDVLLKQKTRELQNLGFKPSANGNLIILMREN